MKLNEQKLDKIFREKLDGFEVTPPESIWNGIQQKLMNQKSKKGIILFRIIAIAAVVVLALIAGWLFNNNQNRMTQPVTENKTQELTIKQTEVLSNPSVPIEPEKIAAVNSENNSDKSDKNLYTTSALKTATNNDLIASEKNPNSDFLNVVEFKLIAMINGFITTNKKIEFLRKSMNKQTEKIDLLSEKEKELIALNSKDYSQKSEKGNNWEVGFRVSPGYSSQWSDHSENYSRNMTYSNTDGNADLSGGVSLGYKASKRWKVESGLYYAQNGQSSGHSFQFFSKNNEAMYDLAAADYFNTPVTIKQGQMAMNSTAGVIEFSKTPNNTELLANLDARSNFSNTLLTSGEFSQVFDFIEVPFYLKYNLIDQKINVDLMGGISANWVVGNNVYMNTGDVKENIGKTTDISKLNYSGTLGVGIAYSMSKRISISLEPRFNYYLNSINKNKEVNYHPYRLGIYTGINYEF
jgi:hypothetical protein